MREFGVLREGVQEGHLQLDWGFAHCGSWWYGGRSGHRSPQLSDFGISQSSLSSEARSRNPNPTVCLISAAKTIGEGIHDAYRGENVSERRGGEEESL